MRQLFIAAFTGLAVLTLATGAEANGNCPAGEALVQTGQQCIMGLLDQQICLPSYSCVKIGHRFHGPFLLGSATSPTKRTVPVAPIRPVGQGHPVLHLR